MSEVPLEMLLAGAGGAKTSISQAPCQSGSGLCELTFFVVILEPETRKLWRKVLSL